VTSDFRLGSPDIFLSTGRNCAVQWSCGLVRRSSLVHPDPEMDHPDHRESVRHHQQGKALTAWLDVGESVKDVPPHAQSLQALTKRTVNIPKAVDFWWRW